ncbi:sulfite exporter TauE/SafE family protein [Microbulbifer sp. ALW1]|uniref:sulfite exporter TauE/SafE family protein n=1 Tax=Microbulbifer sp. (strain ALW1) TaxID=1516059 RepID=UPI001358A80D|nr:sulfite exporter TauE/SafE family protein [Microbulbifer sp. ALW1]
MVDWSYLGAALAIGFFGSSHCIGMCGGISGALGLAVPGQRTAWPRLLGYSTGRVASYTLMGLLVGTLGAYLATDIAAGLAPLRVLAGLMLIAMALYLADWWRGLVWLERGGSLLWKLVQPLSRQLLPVNSTPQAVALGALWGWLPCGLVYSALAFALAQGNSYQAALAMLAFGLGTVPAVMATGVAAARLRTLVQKPGVRLLMALLVLLFGLWTLWGALGHGHGAHASGHEAGHETGHGSHQHMHHGTQSESPEPEAHSHEAQPGEHHHGHSSSTHDAPDIGTSGGESENTGSAPGD